MFDLKVQKETGIMCLCVYICRKQGKRLLTVTKYLVNSSYYIKFSRPNSVITESLLFILSIVW